MRRECVAPPLSPSNCFFRSSIGINVVRLRKISRRNREKLLSPPFLRTSFYSLQARSVVRWSLQSVENSSRAASACSRLPKGQKKGFLADMAATMVSAGSMQQNSAP